MPGIVGIISRKASSYCTNKLKDMLRSMEYESFYQSEMEIVPELGVYFGWTTWSQSIREKKNTDIVQKSCSLALAGEIFSDHLYNQNQKNRNGNLDTDSIKYMYEKESQDFLQNLSGSFAGVIVDHIKRTTLIFNDRFGSKRLFLYEGTDELLFSTEAKAILAVEPKTHAFDPAGLAEFIVSGCTFGDHSLFQGISILPNASLWQISLDGKIKKTIYFHKSTWESQISLDPDTYKEAIISTFSKVVQKYSEYHIPVGISLTGGLDSRMILAVLQKFPCSFKTYTFGSMYRENFDVKIAQEVSEICRHSLTKLIVDKVFLKELPNYMEQAIYRSDGYIGLSGAVELYVNRLAREISIIRLTGNWGGELLRGVRVFKTIKPDIPFINLDLDLDLAIEKYLKLNDLHPLSYTLFQQLTHQGYGRSAIESSQLIIRNPFLDSELLELLYKRPPSEGSGEELTKLIISRYAPSLLSIPTDRGVLGKETLFLQNMRHLYREFLFKAEYFVNNGAQSWMNILNGPLTHNLLARLFIGQHKFYHFGHWLRNDLSDEFVEILLDKAKHSYYINNKVLLKMLNKLRIGNSNNLDTIDKALTIMFTEEIFF
ncbi:MAG: hypothetical protein JEY91_15355 [Spirochaetaceae bacterium]|nr:hypothetical protein [Spirochaetaceae bacterium]